MHIVAVDELANLVRAHSQAQHTSVTRLTIVEKVRKAAIQIISIAHRAEILGATRANNLIFCLKAAPQRRHFDRKMKAKLNLHFAYAIRVYDRLDEASA